MNRGAMILAAVLGGVFLMTVWASSVGLGAPQPDKEPPSVREASARAAVLGAGHHRTRYFIGGGFRSGK